MCVCVFVWERGGGWGLLGLIFAGYVPLAPQNPYPIIVYCVAIYTLSFGNFHNPNLVAFCLCIYLIKPFNYSRSS